MAQPHILIIDDDDEIARLLQLDLQDAGYHTSRADSVIKGLIMAREHTPDLVLLDLGLPDGDGRDILTRLRKHSQVPVIVLTARDVIEDKVALLMLGADDYVVKPFQLPELLARIAVQFRQDVGGHLQVNGLEVRLEQRRALYGGQDLALTPTEFELLALLMQQPGRVYSRQELIDSMRTQDTLQKDSNVMDVHLGNLRSKLRDHGAHGYLRTVRGYGYALRGPQSTDPLEQPVSASAK